MLWFELFMEFIKRMRKLNGWCSHFLYNDAGLMKWPEQSQGNEKYPNNQYQHPILGLAGKNAIFS
jgi:hypothetical protein